MLTLVPKRKGIIPQGPEAASVITNMIKDGSIETDKIEALAITAAKIAADAVTATKIDVVGLNGTTGRIVVADATDANVITGGVNSYATTLIQPGKVVISGSTNLDDWRHGSDTTMIDGGDIYTNTITTTQIAADAVTAAEINVAGLDGTTGRIVVADATDADVITGAINSHATTLIEPGKVVISGETNLDDWRHASDTTLIDGGDIYANSVTVAKMGSDATDRMFTDSTTKTNVEAWRHASDVTLIDGGDIYTGTVTATQISAETITATEIHADAITTVKINDSAVTNEKLGEGNAAQTIVSDVAQHTNSTQQTTTETSYTKIKETKVTTPLENCRVKFDLRSNGAITVYGKVYKNGGAIGTERSTTSGTDVTYSEDFTTFAVDDLIQIYAYTSNVAQGAVVNDFNFCYSLGYAAHTSQDP